MFLFIRALGHLGRHLSSAGYEITKTLFRSLLGHLQVLPGDLQIFVGTVLRRKLHEDISPSLYAMPLQIKKPSQCSSCESKVKSLG